MLSGLRSLAIVGLAATALPLVGSLPLDHDLTQSLDRHVRALPHNINGHILKARQELPADLEGGGELAGGDGAGDIEGGGTEPTQDEPPAPQPTQDEPPVPQLTQEEPPAAQPTEDEPPVPQPTQDEPPAPQPTQDEPVKKGPEENKGKDADTFYLRIMPLGASITEGKPEAPGDKEGNGYRKYLRDHLRSKGWQVNMVGSRQHGTMKDNDHEGKHGDVLSQIEARASKSVRGWLPNIVLINAGTNDARDGKLENAATRMRSLIDTVFSRSPSAVVILSTLLPSDHQEEVDQLNESIRNLTREYIYDVDGKVIDKPQRRLLLAEMVPFIKSDDIHDGIHPTIDGFKKMASVWADAIDRAHDRGWLQKSSTSSNMPDKDAEICRKPFGSGESVDPRGGTQILWAANEVIADDGPYKHESIEHRDFIKGGYWDYSTKEDRLYFANLVKRDSLPGEERDDMIMVRRNTDSMALKRNNGKGEFSDWIKFKVTSFCQNRGDNEAAGVRWADVNGDGLDDFVCISPEGEMYVAINKGAPEVGKPPEFGETFKFRSSLRGRSQLYVHLADIDGDGRVDFCAMEYEGDMYCERNGGTGDGAEYWQDMSDGKPIFTSKAKGDLRGVRFVDLNGDGRWDWMWMDEEGKVETFLNYPADGKGMMPRWVNAGVTHQGMHKNIEETRKHVVFGRIFGTGRNDYVNWEATTGNYPLVVHVWENASKGGRFHKGDGVFFGDFTKTGYDDYAFISPDGNVNIFRNTVSKKDFDNYDTKTWDGPYDALKTGLSRRALHIADWNGDGYADVIGVTDRRSGAIAVWETNWDGKKFSWNRKEIAGSDKCKYGWGRQEVDHAAQLADIDGDGRADYLCMDTAGTVTALLNTKDELKDAGQVKYSEKLDRANFRFADANGDGKADLIWVDKFNGDGKVWYNQGLQKDREGLDGSVFLWDKPIGVSYQGSHRGPNMHFPVLGGHGRADMVGVEGTSAKAWLWYNSCGVSGDDKTESEDDKGDQEVGEDDSSSSSPLPAYEGSDPEDGDPREINPSIYDEKGKHVFCDYNPASWDRDLWNKLDIGNWGLKRSQTYSHIDSKWPDNIPQTFSQYNLNERDKLWDWDATCTAVDDSCSITPESLKGIKECSDQYRRAMWLWAARNYARYLQRLLGSITDVFNSVGKKTDEMIKKFKLEDTPDPVVAPWLSMAMALSLYIGVFPPLATSMGLVATTIIGGNAFIALEAPAAKDKDYQQFGKMMAQLGDAEHVGRKGLEALFNSCFHDIPRSNDMEAGTRLANILWDGQWVLSENIVESYKYDELRQSMLSGIIGSLWNAQKMFIVRWRDDQLRDLKTDKESLSWSPCNGVKTGSKTMDAATACIDEDKGINYAFAALGRQNFYSSMFLPQGTLPEVLATFGFTQADVIQTARQRQNLTNNWLDESAEYLNQLAKLSKDELPPNERLGLTFNMPVCDLTQLDKGELTRDAPLFSDRCGFLGCYSELIAKKCQEMTLGGKKFPYKWERGEGNGGFQLVVPG